MKRKVITIDKSKCIGCGKCASACHQGAIQMIDGKAELVRADVCDGLGRCIGPCPADAISFEEREFADAPPVQAPTFSGCPGKAVKDFTAPAGDASAADVPTELRQWPVQLHLVPVNAPYFQNADLLVCADCVMAAYGDFQRDLLRGRRLLIACPKLDETSEYVEKLTAIFASNPIKSVAVAVMEVPCCQGLLSIVKTALAQCGKPIPLEEVTISIRGEVLSKVKS